MADSLALAIPAADGGEMTAIKAIVVGTGFGCRVHVPALRAAGFDVAGLVGRDPARLRRKAEEAGVAASFTDLDTAIDATGAKLVSIATTPATHAALAHRAIARGCHILCEKPFAFDTSEAKGLLRAANQAGIVHMVAHEFRWLPERALFGQAIADGLVGEPRFLVLDQFLPFCADPDARLPRWWFDTGEGGGWLGANGSHLIDQVRVWLGEFHSLSARLLTVSDRDHVAEDSYSMRFTMRNGVEGSMQQSAGAWGNMAGMTRCAGSTGTIWIEAGKVFIADRNGTRELAMPSTLALPPGGSAQFELGPFTRLAETMRAAIDGKASDSPIAPPTFADGLACMAVMDAMRTSAAEAGALQYL